MRETLAENDRQTSITASPGPQVESVFSIDYELRGIGG